MVQRIAEQARTVRRCAIAVRARRGHNRATLDFSEARQFARDSGAIGLVLRRVTSIRRG
jgi:hypothetical protein